MKGSKGRNEGLGVRGLGVWDLERLKVECLVFRGLAAYFRRAVLTRGGGDSRF